MKTLKNPYMAKIWSELRFLDMVFDNTRFKLPIGYYFLQVFTVKSLGLFCGVELPTYSIHWAWPRRSAADWWQSWWPRICRWRCCRREWAGRITLMSPCYHLCWTPTPKAHYLFITINTDTLKNIIYTIPVLAMWNISFHILQVNKSAITKFTISSSLFLCIKTFWVTQFFISFIWHKN